MSEKAQNELNNNPDELLKSALSVHLSDALPTKEEEVRHAFSVDFAIRIRDLISEADKIVAENEAKAGQSAEAETAADNGTGTEDGIESAAAGSAEHISAAGAIAGAAMSVAAEAQAAERSADTPEHRTPHAEATAAQTADDAADQSEKVVRIQEYQSKSREAAGEDKAQSKPEPEERIAPEAAQRPKAAPEDLSEQSDNFSRAADSAPKTGRGRSRAEAAQDRMNGKILPASFLQRHRRAIVNAASLVLVVGIGAFFLKEGGSLLGGGAKSAAPGSEQSAVAETNGAQTFSAPAASGETEAASAGNETGAQALTEDEAGLPDSGEHAGTGAAQAAPDTEREAQNSAAVPQAASETGGSAANSGERSEQSAQSANVSGSGSSRSETGRTEDADSVGERSNQSGSSQAQSSRKGTGNSSGASDSRTSGNAGNSGQTGKKQSSSGSGTSGKTTRESAARTNSNLPAAGTAGGGTAADGTGAASSGNAGAAGAQKTGTSGTTEKSTTAAHNATAGMTEGTGAAAVGDETTAETTGTVANGGAGLQETEAGTGTAGGTQLPNPIKAVKDPAEFETQLGFAFSVYPEAAEQTETQYSVIADQVAQISYFSEAIDSKMTYRAERKEDLLAELPEQEREPGEAELSEDAWRLLSGIYYPFNTRRTEFWTVRGKNGAPDIPITVRIVQSSESNGALATWEKDGILYTLWAEDASRHRNEVGREAKRLVELTDERAPLR